MREIKFRGKDKDNIWWYGSLYYDKYNAFINSGSVYYHESGDGEICLKHPHEVIMETIGEYTGLKDKNGKEIYEGDRWQRGNFIAVVTFEFSGWHLVKAQDSGCYQYPSFYSNASSGEIIGNIHES